MLLRSIPATLLATLAVPGSGSFIMSNATVTGNGFSAQLTAPGVLMGHIGGVRLGS